MTAPVYDFNDYADLPVGEILRRARAHYNLSLEDVERALRIRAVQLAALETGQIEQLPGRVYAIGFVRAYAEYLGLDGHKMVMLFKDQAGGVKPRPELSFPVAASDSRVPGKWVLGGSLGALAVVLAFVFMSGGKDHADAQIPFVPAAKVSMSGTMNIASQPPLAAAVLNAMDTAAGTEGPKAFVAPQSRIVITAVDNAWVEVRDAEGKPLISRIFKPGDSYLVPEQGGLKMDTGNAGALSLVVDGSVPFPLGEKGDVKRGVRLEPEMLAKLIPAAPAVAVEPEQAAEPVPETAKPKSKPQQEAKTDPEPESEAEVAPEPEFVPEQEEKPVRTRGFIPEGR